MLSDKKSSCYQCYQKIKSTNQNVSAKRQTNAIIAKTKFLNLSMTTFFDCLIDLL